MNNQKKTITLTKKTKPTMTLTKKPTMMVNVPTSSLAIKPKKNPTA